MARKQVQVFSSQAVDGNSTVVTLPDAVSLITVTVSGTGTWTVTLQHSPDAGTTWVNTDTLNAQWTASGAANAELLPGTQIRLNQADSATAVVDAWIDF